MKKAPRSFKVGGVMTTKVEQEHIDKSDPCDKQNCMFTLALIAYLVATYGDQDYDVRSTNHGAVFDLHGRRYTAVFNTKTAEIICQYDRVYEKTRNKAKARATVKPFKARVIIEGSIKVPTFPPMDAATKKRLRAIVPKGKPKPPGRLGIKRQLSM